MEKGERRKDGKELIVEKNSGYGESSEILD
jgi:hypothetical protein